MSESSMKLNALPSAMQLTVMPLSWQAMLFSVRITSSAREPVWNMES